MENDKKIEVKNLWALLQTDPLSAYAQSGHPEAQYYFLLRDIQNPEVEREVKTSMMVNILKHLSSYTILKNFSLEAFWHLGSELVLSQLFLKSEFETKLLDQKILQSPTERSAFCALFCLYCVHLDKYNKLLNHPLLITQFLKVLALMDNPLKFEFILPYVENVCPAITADQLTALYKLMYPKHTLTQLTMRYLSLSPSISSPLKVGSILDIDYIPVEINRIWQRCLTESYIKDYECLIRIASLALSTTLEKAEEMIHLSYPHLLYGNLQYYKSGNEIFRVNLLADRDNLLQLSPEIIVSNFKIAIQNSQNISVIYQIIKSVNLSHDLYCELLLLILTSNQHECIFEVLCDIKLLFEVQTEYEAQRRYFGFLQNNLFSKLRFSTHVLKVVQNNPVLKSITTLIPNFNELITEFSLLEQSLVGLTIEDRQLKQANYQPKKLLGENQRIPKRAIQRFEKPVAEVISPPPAKREDIFIIADSPKLRSTLRIFQDSLYSKAKIPQNGQFEPTVEFCMTAMLHLFPKGEIRQFLLSIDRSKITFKNLRMACLKNLLDFIPAHDIDQFLNGKKNGLALNVVFSLNAILKVSCHVVDCYVNARYEREHIPLQYQHQEPTIFLNY